MTDNPTPPPSPVTNAIATVIAKSSDWRHAAGWVVVCVLFWRFLVYPIANVIAVYHGHDPLAQLAPLSMGDAAALAGVPMIGLIAGRAGQ